MPHETSGRCHDRAFVCARSLHTVWFCPFLPGCVYDPLPRVQRQAAGAHGPFAGHAVGRGGEVFEKSVDELDSTMRIACLGKDSKDRRVDVARQDVRLVSGVDLLDRGVQPV